MTTRYRPGSDDDARPSASPIVGRCRLEVAKVGLACRIGCRHGDEDHVDADQIELAHRDRSEALSPPLDEHVLVDVAERNLVTLRTQRGSLSVADDAGPDGDHAERSARCLRGPWMASGTIMRSREPLSRHGSGYGGASTNLGGAYGEVRKASRRRFVCVHRSTGDPVGRPARTRHDENLDSERRHT